MRGTGGVEETLVDVEMNPRDAGLDDLQPRFEQVIDRRCRIERFQRGEMGALARRRFSCLAHAASRDSLPANRA